MNCYRKSKFSKYIRGLLGLMVLMGFIFSLLPQVSAASEEREILYYTCGMHPSVKVSPEEYNKGNVNCPVCNMKLTPVYKQEAKASLSSETQATVSRVKINGEQIKRAGVQTEALRKLHLSKEIRTVGKVAYDPKLAIAQDEFISALKALDKIKKGNILEIKKRTQNLVESSKRKLRLLGLSRKQIKELERTRQVQTSLILPEEKMWIYGDVYEYELSWVKQGEKVKITTPSLPGEEFEGVISSINPVVDPKVRSVTFRAEIDNPDLKLKPQMYVDVVIQSMYMGPGGEHMVLAIPKDAVLDTGIRKIVWVDIGDDEYEGRLVEIGPEATATVDEKKVRVYPVLEGLSEGEQIVTKANFLIDSQSQITGVAAAAYGGALGAQEKKTPAVHQH